MCTFFVRQQYHQNTAPFLAVRFAQRFGISNPSPRYIAVMANAFRTGRFDDFDTGFSFGSGAYGDIGAMVAAMLLDREARSEVLDVDPVHGSIQEPFLKVVRVMRSLEFETATDRPLINFGSGLSHRIGQEAHELPDVFSFFLPEYSPPGTCTHWHCAKTEVLAPLTCEVLFVTLPRSFRRRWPRLSGMFCPNRSADN